MNTYANEVVLRKLCKFTLDFITFQEIYFLILII